VASRGLADTSIFVAADSGRGLGALPAELAVATVTLTELELGVLAAREPADRARRLRTLTDVRAAVQALSLDERVASRLAELLAELRAAGRKPKVFDTIIAATALHHELPVYTQDGDLDAIADVHGTLRVERV
jgi:predicted nucleic acid-binding protein